MISSVSAHLFMIKNTLHSWKADTSLLNCITSQDWKILQPFIHVHVGMKKDIPCTLLEGAQSNQGQQGVELQT